MRAHNSEPESILEGTVNPLAASCDARHCSVSCAFVHHGARAPDKRAVSSGIAKEIGAALACAMVVAASACAFFVRGEPAAAPSTSAESDTHAQGGARFSPVPLLFDSRPRTRT